MLDGLKVVEGDGRMDGPTDRPTDRETERPTDRQTDITKYRDSCESKNTIFRLFGLQSGPPFARDGSPIKLIINSSLIPH